MPHRNAVKGANWERWCANFLGAPRTLHKGRHDDKGDLEDDHIVYECKADNSRSPVQWWAQAEAARKRAAKPWAVVLAKTACLTGKPKRPDEPAGWATMSIEQWKDMRDYIRTLEDIARVTTGHTPSARALRRRDFYESVGLDYDAVSIPQGSAPISASEPAA